VLTEVATLAPDARRFEPAISAAQAAAQPGRIVWIVQVSGDFLNLRDLPWSRQGAPDPSGYIVIDDTTGTILGVYPHDPPGT
jgi:cystathionine beta-lyase/cystathionine gamma-synthase